MNAEIGTVAVQLLFWEYSLRNFGTAQRRLARPKPTSCQKKSRFMRKSFIIYGPIPIKFFFLFQQCRRVIHTCRLKQTNDNNQLFRTVKLNAGIEYISFRKLHTYLLTLFAQTRPHDSYSTFSNTVHGVKQIVCSVISIIAEIFFYFIMQECKHTVQTVSHDFNIMLNKKGNCET